MEPLGLAIAIPPLLSLVFDILEKVTAFQDHGISSRQLNARFVSAKFRLQDWSRNVGIFNRRLVQPHHPRLDRPEVVAIVKTVLDCLIETFDKSQEVSNSLSKQYGTTNASSEFSPPPRTNTGSNRLMKSAHTAKEAFSWAVKGKNVFTEQVESFEILVDRLYDIVPPDSGSGNAGDDVLDTSVLKSFETLQREVRLVITTKLQDARREAQRAIDDWLGTPIVDQEYDEHIKTRLEGTCNWIYENEAYKAWISDDFHDNKAKIFWISGSAGHGKTILNSDIVRTVKKFSTFPMVYFFATSHVQAQCQPLDVLRSWISQLCSVDDGIFDLVRDIVHTDHSNRRGTPSEVWSLLGEIVAKYDHCTLAVDGYDEFPKGNPRSDFLSKLTKTISDTQTRLLISSRPEEDIGSELVHPTREMKGVQLYQCRVTAEHVKQDIYLYTQKTVVDQLPKQSQEWQQELADQMARKCDGMFLWIKLQKSQLRQGKSRKQLLKSIEKMPSGLTSTYDRNWQAVQALPEEDRLRAVNIFRWACFAVRPLTVSELTEALVHEGEELETCEDDLPDQIDEAYIDGEIRGLCGSLIEVQAVYDGQELSQHVIRVIHSSAREFLVGVLTSSVISPIISAGGGTIPDHHLHLATVCVRYLLCQATWYREPSEHEIGRERPFYTYAKALWRDHTRTSEAQGDGFKLLTLRLFDSKNPHTAQWIRDIVLDYTSEPEEGELEIGLNLYLYLAVSFNLPHVVDYLCDSQQLDFTPTQFPDTTALILSVYGEDAMFDRLLDCGADVNVEGGPWGSALNTAVYANSLYRTKKLLDLGASTEILSESGQSVLSLACAHGSNMILELLLERKANPNYFVHFYNNPLRKAIDRDDTRALELLIQHGADITLTDKFGNTLVHYACYSTNARMLELLLEAGAEVSRADQQGHTPLYYAVAQDTSDLAALLIKYGADVSTADPLYEGWTLLQFAVNKDNIEMVQILIDAGSRLNDTGVFMSTPLFAAIERGNMQMVGLLIDSGADLSEPIVWGRTPLDYIEFLHPGYEKIPQWRSATRSRLKQSDRNYGIKHEIYTTSERMLQGGRIHIGFDWLGRNFAHLHLPSDANFAFQQRILSGKTPLDCEHDVTCDNCEVAVIKGTRHVCLDCLNTDLCTKCYDLMETGTGFKRCRQHRFMQISGTREPPITSVAERLQAPEVIQWLEQNVTKFKPEIVLPERTCEGD